MNKIDFKTAYRNIKKNRILSVINILGLAIGITVCLIIYQYVAFELSYDKFNEDSKQLYRIERDPFCTIAPSFVPLLKQDFPEIDCIARITSPWNFNIKYGDITFMEDNVCFAEPDIFKILTFKFIEGNPENVLGKDQVVITKSIAEKYFGDENPVGKKLVADNENTMTVSGVIEDYPDNSHLKCDFICSYLSLRNSDVNIENDYFLGNNNFSDNVVLAYVKFNKNSDIGLFNSKIPSFIDRYIPAGKNDQGQDIPASSRMNFTVRQVEDIHLYSHKLNEVRTNSDISYIYLFSVLAVLIIAIACINFFNLSTATIDKRFNETGVKKVFGIKKCEIYFQFIAESFFLVLASTLIALILSWLLQPVLKSFVGISINFKLINPILFYSSVSGLIIILSFVTGFVPGNHLARLKPIRMLKEKSISKPGKVGYRNVLVVFQFVAAIGLFVSTGAIYKQMDYIKSKDLGFDKENIVLIPAQDEIINNWNSIYQQLLSNSNIKEACLSKSTIGGRLLDDPGLQINLNGSWERFPGKIPHIRTDHNFFKTYGIKIIAGRDFDSEISTDSESAFILNETAVKQLGIENYNDIIGKQVGGNGKVGKVIGVANDFNYESLHTTVIPMVTYISLNSANTLSVKINQASANSAVRYIESVLDDYCSDFQFTYSFFDSRLADQYINESKMMSLTGFASVLAIFIAGLGLLGLSLFFTERKTKEIGIRKVNGARVSEVVSLLNKDFIKWVNIAFIVSAPVAFFLMNNWLKNFAYKTNLSWWIFALSGLLALGIALLTVSFQSWRAARRNPVEALRYE
ncbi:MAG: ABC transporter permease [Prolixibacteraceae bacterium]|nr:ABC transporter permease [Prolixibacteraceae bacterium]